MLWTIVIIFTFLLCGLGTGVYISAPRYTGVLSDHFNGRQFETPGGVKAKGLWDVLKWSFNRDRGPWKTRSAYNYGDPPPRQSDSLRVTFINHSTFLLQMDGINILTDPVYSKRTSPFQWAGPKRMRPPGIRFEDLPPIHCVIISHNHYDHLDVATVKRLQQAHQPTFISPLGVGQYMQKLGLEKTYDLDWWQEYEVDERVRIQSVPTQHFSGRGMLDRDATLWCGYVIKRSEGNVYFAGDTGYNPKMFVEIGQRSGPFQLSLIPIGAYLPRWFMSPIHTSPHEAVMIHKDVQSRQSIGIHYGTFALADEGEQQPVDDLKKALSAQQIPEDAFWTMTEGEGRTVK